MKIPNPQKMSSGNYYIYLRLNGQKISVTDSSKSGCIAKARSIKARYKAGELDFKPPDSKGTLKTLGEVVDAYIAKYEPVLSPSTIRGYAIIRRNRFSGSMSKELNTIDYQAMINAELDKVSVKTVKNAWGLISAALKMAGVPVPAVKLPQETINELPFLQPEEIHPFLRAAEGDGTEIYMLLMLHSLRVSEALHVVQERTVDIKRGKIYVTGSIVPGKDNKMISKSTTKNKSSRRAIDIMIPRLATIWGQYERGELTPKTGMPTNILHHVQSVCRAAGVTVVSNHGLRHSFASLAYDLGWSERMIMEVGGWSNPATMHKIYIRITQSRKKESINSMSEFFKNAK